MEQEEDIRGIRYQAAHGPIENEEEGAESGGSGEELGEKQEDAEMIEADYGDDAGDEDMAEEEDEEEDDVDDDDDDEGEDDEGDEEDVEEEEGEEQDEDDDEDVEDDEDDEDIEDDEDDDEWENFEETEKCPVCLDAFLDKEVGTPESCDHIFCFDCILEWSRNINTCPVDRSLFRSILVRHSLHGEVVRRIEVDERKPDEQDEEDATYCEVCGRCDREDRLLLCDGCDAGYHCECLDPPLVHIPIEEWYCPECVAQNRHQEEESSEEELEVIDHPSVGAAGLSERRDPSVSRRRRHMTREHPPARAIARTHVSERVRARITQARAAERQHKQNVAGPSISRPRLTSTTRKKPAKRKTVKKRKTTRKRCSTKKRRAASKTGTTTASGKVVRKRKFKRRKKRRSKTIKRVTKAAVPKTIRERIAGKLMLVKPRTGSMMPDIKVKGQQSLGFRRNEIGAATLTITGSDNLLDMSEMSSVSMSEAPTTRPSTSQFVSSSSTSDLLGSIISGQDMLHMPSKDVTIHRDGSLTKISQESKNKELKQRKSSDCQIKGQALEKETTRQIQISTSCGDDKRKGNSDHQLHKETGKRKRFSSDEKDEEDSQKTSHSQKTNSADTNVTGTPGKEVNQEIEGEDKHFKRDRSADVKDGIGHTTEKSSSKDQTDEQRQQKNSGSADEDDEDGDDDDGGDVEMEDIEEDDEGEMEEQDQISDAEKVSGKHDGSITCQASSSSFEESHSEEEGAVEESKASRRSRGKAEPEEEGLIREPEKPKHQDHRNSKVKEGDSRDGSGRSRRKSSYEEGLIEEDEDGLQTERTRRKISLSSSEGLIEDEQDYKMRAEKQRQMAHSDEEGLIADDEDGNKPNQNTDTSRKFGRHEGDKGHTGHSSAEEGEVKTDDEEGSSSTRKKRKRDRRRQRNRKDTRTVVIDSEMSLTIPKRPMVEIQREQKMNSDSRISDSAVIREREFERPETSRGEHGVFGDLRHVIQVKRDVPFKRPSRYEAYWAELERQRAIEAQIAEKAVAWERHGIYERPYPYEEDWNRIMLERKPLEPQWENFTIHRERSPTIDWRKERDGVEGRVEAERRIEMVQQVDLDRRFEAKRREEAGQKMEAERRLAERKVDARKDQERDKKSDSSRVSTKKIEVDKARSDHKDLVPKRDARQKGGKESKMSQKSDANRRQNPNSGGDNGRRKHDSKRDSKPKGDASHSEKERSAHKEKDRQDKVKDKSKTDAKKHRDMNKLDTQSRNPELLKSSSNRGKDQHKDKHETHRKQKSDRDVSKDRQIKESSKGKSHGHSREHSASRDKDRSHRCERSSSLGGDHLVSNSRHHPEKRLPHSESRSKEHPASRGHSEHSSKHSQDYSGHSQEHVDLQSTNEDSYSDKHKRGKSRDKASATSKEKETNQIKDKNRNRETDRMEQNNVQQATSTSDHQMPPHTKSVKRSIRRARSPSSSQTGETGDEFEASHQQSTKLLPITVPATEMITDKPVVEKVKKKKKDKTKKIKNKANEKDGTKAKKVKKTKAGKTKKQKVVDEKIAHTENITEEPKDDEQVAEQPEEQHEEHQEQLEEAAPEIPENKRPASPAITTEPAKEEKTEEATEQTTEQHETEENKNTQGNEKDGDSSSDVEMVIGPVTNIYDEIIDLSQISSDEESFPQMSTSGKQGKDSALYDPFEPTASPETISSPDMSEKNVSQRHSQRSRDRSRSPQRRTTRSPVTKRSSPKRRSSPRRPRSISPRRKSPPKQKGSSKERGYSSRKRSVSPPRKSLQKRRSPSPRRNISARKPAHSPRRSPSRSERRQASPKRHVSPRKRSPSPRGQSSSKRRKVEPSRRHSVSPRRRKASPKKSISPRRRFASPRRRSRSPRKRSASPRHRVPPKKRSISPRKRSVPPKRTISPRRRSPSPKRRHTSPRRRVPSPRARHISPKKQIELSRRQSVSPRRRSISPHRRDFSMSKRTLSPRRSMSSRSSSTSSRSSRSPSSSSSWTSSTGSWSSSSYSRSPSDSRSPTASRSPSPRGRRYSDRSSSSFRSESSFSSDRSSSPERTPPRRRSPSPQRIPVVLRQSPTQTSPTYRHRIDSHFERTSPVQPRQELPDSTQGSYRVVPTSPGSPDQSMAPATSTTDSHLASKATSQISHILGQLACNPAIQSALNSANLMQSQRHGDTHSSDGSISGFLKSSETSFTSPPGRPLEIREEIDKDLQSLADVNEDNIESSAVDLYNKNSRERYLKKLQHQERVVEEVKLALKPYYQKREVSKDDYKEILRKSVNQVCHSKSGEINPVKIKKLIEGYIKKFRGKKKLEEKKETSRPDLTFRLMTKS